MYAINGNLTNLFQIFFFFFLYLRDQFVRNERCEGMCLDLDLEAGTNTVFVLQTLAHTQLTVHTFVIWLRLFFINLIQSVQFTNDEFK